MRLYGSLTNRLMENAGPPTPVVGMGATVLMYSDRHAATIVEIVSAKRIVIQEDTATRTDSNGMSESQQYAFTPNPAAARQLVTLRKDGRWRLANSQTVIRLGTRDEYRDFSF